MRRRALILTSNALRHRYFMDRIAMQFEVVGAMREPKKNYFNKVRAESSAVEAHFAQLAEAEQKFFVGPLAESPVPIASVEVADLNASEVVAAAKKLAPDVVCLFGTSILKAPWLEAFPNCIVNLHLGLSPYYRGAATLFWPFHDGRLECLGTTMHLAIAKVDAGAILKRIKPRFEVGDSYYTITTRLIRDSLDQFPAVAMDYLEGKLTPFAQENYPQARVMKKADFTEAALAKALAHFGTGLTQQMINDIAQSKACLC